MIQDNAILKDVVSGQSEMLITEKICILNCDVNMIYSN